MDNFVPLPASSVENGKKPNWRRLIGMEDSRRASLSRILGKRPMIPTLEQILGRVDDPETPVVWLDPAIPAEFWKALPEGLRSRGYRVFHIDQNGDIEDRRSLLARFDSLVHLRQPYTHDFESLKRCLLALAAECERGWAVLFSNPDPLRQADEEAFEELMEVLELVHESIYEIHRKSFKFVVRD